MASDLLSTIRAELDSRLKELRPSLAEYERLLAAVDALVDGGGPLAKLVAPRARRASRPTRARPATRGSAGGAIKRAGGGAAPKPSKPPAEAAKPKRVGTQRGAARESILAALDHGSHTVGELAVVTAMSASNINGNLRRMAFDGAVIKTEREGKTAYALPRAG
jgi:hypothetical protein